MPRPPARPASNSPSPARATGIQSIEIGFELVRALVHSGEPLPLKQIAQAAAMSPSKARMYLVSLIRIGLIAQSEQTGLYQLGHYAAELGAVALRRTDLLAAAQLIMEELARRTGALMLLSGWGHGGVTLLRQTTGSDALPIDFRIGGRTYLTRTATGLVCLAFLPAHVTAGQCAAEMVENRCDPDLAFIDEGYLVDVVTSVRSSAIATVKNVRVGSGLVLVGYTALAAPILDRDGQLRLVMTALLPKRRPKVDLVGTRTLLREAAHSLSARTVLPPSPAIDKGADGNAA